MCRFGIGTVDEDMTSIKRLRTNAHVDIYLWMASDPGIPWWTVAQTLVSCVRLQRFDALILDPSAETYPTTCEAWKGIHDLIHPFKHVYTTEAARCVLWDSM